MLGIKDIGVFIPENRISNHGKKSQFGFDDQFLDEKIGVYTTSLKDEGDGAADLCVKAFEALERKARFQRDDIDILLVVTQNPDMRIPHTSAIVHGMLDLPLSCATFDISLGCSGYVYGLSTIISLMKDNGFGRGVLITSDPYSDIIDQNDKNTTLLFGDAAAATLITDDPILKMGKSTFGTMGQKYEEIKLLDGKLHMNGRAVVKFVKKYVPDDIRKVLEKNSLHMDDIDRFILHQGSKFIVKTLTKDLEIDESRIPFDIYDFGSYYPPLFLYKKQLMSLQIV